MRQIISLIHNHKATFIISLLSAILAVTIQLVLTAIVSRDTSDNMRDIYLEDATGFIVSRDERAVATQGSNILQQDDLTLFRTGQIVEDTIVKKEVKQQEFMISNLITPLDTKGTIIDGNKVEKNLKMRLVNSANINMSVCENLGQTGKSCTEYLTNKSAQSIPVDIRLVLSPITGESSLNVRYPAETISYPGSFSGEAVELDIRPL